jgi:hypothetical protein
VGSLRCLARVGLLGLLGAPLFIVCPVVSSATAVSVSLTHTGPKWRVQTSPNPTASVASYLSSVSCNKDRDCMAVGTYYTTFNPPPGIQYTLAERWNGTSWAIVSTPPISGVDNALLSGVSCANPDSCLAVGYTVTSPDNPVVRALVESWNGTSWSTVPTPLPSGGTGTTLSGVWCAKSNACVAVGALSKKNSDVPLAESWNGSAWTILNAPNPHAENGSAFTAIDCVKTSNCEVTGDYDYANVAQSLIAYSYRNTTWTAQKQKNPLGQEESNSNNGVSCIAVDTCTSVGNWTNNAPLALAESWNGTSWSRQKLPAPSGSKTDEVNGVSCASEDACATVGDWGDSLDENPSFTLAEEWNGSAWHVAKTPDLSGTSSSLSDVSCIATALCIAVGYSFDMSTEIGVSLAEMYSQ